MIRLPAEWEAQQAVMLTWPHAESDWNYLLEEIELFYVHLAQQLSRFVKVIIAAPESNKQTITDQLSGYNVEIFNVESNDTWARDHGPITVEDDGRLTLLDFIFNGWGDKFTATKDNQITKQLHQAGAFPNTNLKRLNFVLEGGGIESNGSKTLLTTEQCLLNPNRNPTLNKADIEQTLKSELGVETIHWLKHGHLAGDDTDSHIDTLARLCPDDTILYIQANDCGDEHYDAITAMEYELAELRCEDGSLYSLIPLPMPAPIYDPEDGHRLPATYANYLVANGAVFVPIYGDKNDKRALKQVAKAFPEHEIIGIDCNILIRQHGSLHCITMQIPAGK